MAFFEYDFTGPKSLVRGDDFIRVMKWKTGNPPVAVNLTGWTGILNLYKPGSDTLVLNDPVTLTSDGKITINLSKVQTPPLPKGDLIYFITLTDTLGLVQTKIHGHIRVL